MNTAGLAKPLQDGDLLQIYALSPRSENAVSLRGAVANPGRFPWREGMRVRDVIPTQESLVVPEYWQRLNRSSAAVARPAAEPQRLDRPSIEGARTETPADLPRNPAGRMEMMRLFDEINWDYAVVERLNSGDLTTSIIPFNLGRAVLEGEPTHNLSLGPRDIVTVFSRLDVPVPVAKQTQLCDLQARFARPASTS